MPFTSISAGWIFTLMGLLDDGRPLNQGKSHFFFCSSTSSFSSASMLARRVSMVAMCFFIISCFCFIISGFIIPMPPPCPMPPFIICCQPWRAKRRLVDPSSREAALLTRRAHSARGEAKWASKRGVQSLGDKYGAATSLRSCCVVLGDQDGWGTNRLSKAKSILGTGMSQNLSRGRRHTWMIYL